MPSKCALNSFAELMRPPGSSKSSASMCARKAARPSRTETYDDVRRLPHHPVDFACGVRSRPWRSSVVRERWRARRQCHQRAQHIHRGLEAAPRREAVAVSVSEQMSQTGGRGCPSARVVCWLCLLAGIDPASRLITASRGAKEVNLSPCRRNRQRTRGRLRRAVHVALKQCNWRERRRASADCPTCTPSSASAARPPTSRKAGRQDGATRMCFVCFANKRANAAGWQR
jgi:hypothetical protein